MFIVRVSRLSYLISEIRVERISRRKISPAVDILQGRIKLCEQDAEDRDMKENKSLVPFTKPYCRPAGDYFQPANDLRLS